MNKNLLIKHIKGEATENENQEVSAWLCRDKRNESYYITLMNLLVSQDMMIEEHHIFSKREVVEKLIDVKTKIKEKEGDGGNNSQLSQKVKRTKYVLFTAIAASALLLLSIALNVYQLKRETGNSQISSQVMNPEREVINTFYTERGVKGKIVLEDSTVVWLNSDSKIVYPEHFSTDSRQIQFEGEGFFEVTKNTEWPMVVTTAKGMSVKVLGTKFHIRSYRNDDSEQATLFSGKIHIVKEVEGKGGRKMLKTIDVTPNETVIFGKNGVEWINHNTDTTKKIAWKRGELLFEETPMSEVVKMLERWHGVKIIVLDKSVLKYNFTASFNSESLVQIMELIKFTSPVNYNVVDNIVYLRERKI
jgi:ferric-dicitrate binding protein FerR (iron transport regulator)